MFHIHIESYSFVSFLYEKFKYIFVIPGARKWIILNIIINITHFEVPISTFCRNFLHSWTILSIFVLRDRIFLHFRIIARTFLRNQQTILYHGYIIETVIKESFPVSLSIIPLLFRFASLSDLPSSSIRKESREQLEVSLPPYSYHLLSHS